MSLARIVSDRAAEKPERPALRFEGEVVTYRDLDGRAAVAASALRELGVGVDDRVAIRLPNSTAYVAALLGALRLGAIAVPLNVLLADPEVESRIAVAQPVTVVDRPLPTDGHGVSEIAPRQSADPAAIIFTSGTTGTPKGAILTHGGIEAAAAFCADALAIGCDDVILGVAPFPHVLGQQMLVSAAIACACVSIMPRFEAAQALATMIETGTTILVGVPTMCIALCETARGTDRLPPLRIAHVGGSSVPREVASDVERTLGAAVHEGYGLTEMSGLAATFRIGSRRKPGSVGRPSDATLVRIAQPDERGVGEIQFRGPSTLAGFWNDPDATSAALDAEGWLSTGDVGYLDEDGDLFLVDRKKEMIIRGGYNVYPREVEEVLYGHPDVLEAAVVGVTDERLGEEVVAYVVTRPGARLDAGALKEWTRERLAAYKYPRQVVLVDDLPKSPTGKILKRELVGRMSPGAAHGRPA